jgi:hypothetical protein
MGTLLEEDVVLAGGIGMDQTVLDATWLGHSAPGSIAEGDALVLQGYPNPAGDHFFVPLPPTFQTCQATLFNALGASILQLKHQGPELVLQLAGMPPGGYLLKLSSESSVAVIRFWSTNTVR